MRLPRPMLSSVVLASLLRSAGVRCCVMASRGVQRAHGWGSGDWSGTLAPSGYPRAIRGILNIIPRLSPK